MAAHEHVDYSQAPEPLGISHFLLPVGRMIRAEINRDLATEDTVPVTEWNNRFHLLAGVVITEALLFVGAIGGAAWWLTSWK